MKTIILDRPHTHAGKQYDAGTTLENVSDRSAAWLLARGIGHEAPGQKDITPPKPARDIKDNQEK